MFCPKQDTKIAELNGRKIKLRKIGNECFHQQRTTIDIKNIVFQRDMKKKKRFSESEKKMLEKDVKNAFNLNRLEIVLMASIDRQRL